MADSFAVNFFSVMAGLFKLIEEFIALFNVDVDRDVSSIDILTLEFN